MRKAAGPIIGVLIALLVAGVAFLNQSSITLDLWFTEVSIPLWALLAGTFLLGLLAGILFLLPGMQGRRNRVDELEEELDRTKREKETIAEETRRESEADLTQKNSEINGLNARIKSLEDEVRNRIRNSPHNDEPDGTNDRLNQDNLNNGGNQPKPSRKERRANKRRDDSDLRPNDTNRDDTHYPESPENNMKRPEVDSNVESRPVDHKSFDRRDDEGVDGEDQRNDNQSPDADLVVKEVDETDSNR